MSDEHAPDYGPDDPVPGDAIMVRGAPVTVPILRSNARKAWKLKGFYGVSMFAFPSCDADKIAEKASIPHDDICEAKAETIRAAGFELKRTFDTPGHFSLIFTGEPSTETLETVKTLFTECKENKYKRSG